MQKSNRALFINSSISFGDSLLNDTSHNNKSKKKIIIKIKSIPKRKRNPVKQFLCIFLRLDSRSVDVCASALWYSVDSVQCAAIQWTFQCRKYIYRSIIVSVVCVLSNVFNLCARLFYLNPIPQTNRIPQCHHQTTRPTTTNKLIKSFIDITIVIE